MPWYIVLILVIAGLIGAFITYILVNALVAKNKRNVSDAPRKNVDEDLEIKINNKNVATGESVKLDEKMSVRISNFK